MPTGRYENYGDGPHGTITGRDGHLKGGTRMNNTLGDLNNHLFAQLERLGDEDLKGTELEAEIGRSEAMAKIGEQIIRTGELQLKAMRHMDEYGYDREKAVPEMLEVRR